MILFEGLAAQVVGLEEQRLGLQGLVLAQTQQAEIAQAFGNVRVVGRQDPLPGRQGPRDQGLGLGEPPLQEIERAERVARGGQARIAGLERPFQAGERGFEEPFGRVQAAAADRQRAQAAEARGQFRIVGAMELLADRERPAQARLGPGEVAARGHQPRLIVERGGDGRGLRALALGFPERDGEALSGLGETPRFERREPGGVVPLPRLARRRQGAGRCPAGERQPEHQPERRPERRQDPVEARRRCHPILEKITQIRRRIGAIL